MRPRETTSGADGRAARCCVAGGGPAGMVLGLLLARAGVDVVVLEKHADFLRDFRGDTLHPSTLEVMGELGLLDALLRLPHQRVPQIRAQIGDAVLSLADFDRLPTRCRFIAFMPQWDFLDFLARESARYPTFRLRMRTEATGVIEEGGRIVGVRGRGAEGPFEERADLVVAADGRGSAVTASAGVEVEELGAPMDVLWFRLSRRPEDLGGSMGRFEAGQIFVMIDRGQYWQCGYVIPKGTLAELHRAGLAAFHDRVRRLAGALGDRVGEIATWDDASLLTVRVSRARRWYRDGFLCIGDAAHAMSPIGGVGINLAIQDAVAAANILAAPLRAGRLAAADLARVQRRREWPTRLTQRMQLFVQDRVISGVLRGTRPLRAPLVVRLLARVAALRRLTGRLVGLGVRPEHISAPAGASRR